MLIINTNLYSTAVSNVFHKRLDIKYIRPVSHTALIQLFNTDNLVRKQLKTQQKMNRHGYGTTKLHLFPSVWLRV